LTLADHSTQDAAAQLFITQAALTAHQKVGVFGSFNATYVGHSLGGFLAQTASAHGPEGDVVVFNAPGVGGFVNL
jgi:pimeloyl-ACP methyl ester carboxylesterase